MISDQSSVPLGTRETSYLTDLECTACGARTPANRLQTVCAVCAKALFPRYDLERARRELDRDAFAARASTIWRWRELLPVHDSANIVTLGEGGTPLLATPRLGEKLACHHLSIKDESGNPMGSFKSRGVSTAVSRARELGAKVLVIPTAGNVGGAVAAYAARAGMPVHVFVPNDAPEANRLEAQVSDAHVHMVNGTSVDAARIAREYATSNGFFELPTLQEPYRVEGKKTMGYELALDLCWELPDAIIYPVAGGTGFVGLWKAFDELEALGWIGPRRPRMFAVQPTGCAPIVRAIEQGATHAEPWANPHTIANGLRVPEAFGDYQILRTIRASNGHAVAVTDEQILQALWLVRRTEGLLLCPEGALTVAALTELLKGGHLRRNERVVLFNTASGLKYLEVLRQAAQMRT